MESSEDRVVGVARVGSQGRADSDIKSRQPVLDCLQVPSADPDSDSDERRRRRACWQGRARRLLRAISFRRAHSHWMDQADSAGSVLTRWAQLRLRPATQITGVTRIMMFTLADESSWVKAYGRLSSGWPLVPSACAVGLCCGIITRKRDS